MGWNRIGVSKMIEEKEIVFKVIVKEGYGMASYSIQ